MLKYGEMIKRLKNMIGKELTKENLAYEILFDMPKLLRKQLEHHSSAVTYQITQTPDGHWAKIDLAGSNVGYRVGLKQDGEKYIVVRVVDNRHWLEKLLDEFEIGTRYRLEKLGGPRQNTTMNWLDRGTSFKNIPVESVDKIVFAICNTDAKYDYCDVLCQLFDEYIER